MIIVSDAATSAPKEMAIGVFFCLPESDLTQYSTFSTDNLALTLADKIIFKKYVCKKSTWAEIKTVIDALYHTEKISKTERNIELYTDCQSVIDLLGRRKDKLQKNNFITRSGKILQNAELYQELFKLTEKFSIQTFKIQGHAPDQHRHTVQEKIFSVLDKLCRRKLREE